MIYRFVFSLYCFVPGSEDLRQWRWLKADIKQEMTWVTSCKNKMPSALLILFVVIVWKTETFCITGSHLHASGTLMSRMQINEIQYFLWISITKYHFHITSYLTELFVFWWLFRKEDTLWRLITFISGHNGSATFHVSMRMNYKRTCSDKTEAKLR